MPEQNRADSHADNLEPAVKVFEELGCAVEEACPDLSGADEVFRTLRAWHWDVALGPLLDERRADLKPSLAANIEAGRALTGSDVGRAEALHTALFHRVREFFGRYDALLLPVSQVPPFDAAIEYPDEVAGHPVHDYLEWMRSCFLVSATGCPALSVPAGFTGDGLPIGLQIVGPHRADLDVLRIGHAFEQATRHGTRRPGLA